jgi:hypothetical protein
MIPSNTMSMIITYRKNNLGDYCPPCGLISFADQRGGLCGGDSKGIWQFYGPLPRGFAQSQFIDR